MRPRIVLLLWVLMVLWPTSAAGQDRFAGIGPLSVRRQSHQMLMDNVQRLKAQLASDPSNLTVQIDLGRTYYLLAEEREGDAQFQAESIFEKILQQHPDNATALAYHGSLLGLKLGYQLVPPEQMESTLQQADREMDRAIQLQPNSIEIRELRAYAAFFTPSFFGRDALAVSDFTRAIDLMKQMPGNNNDDLAALYLLLGDTYNKMGQADKAQANWRTAVSVSPGSATAAQARLLGEEARQRKNPVDLRALAGFFGFLLGTVIFALLATELFLEILRAGEHRWGMVGSFLISLSALIWSGLGWLAFTLPAIMGYSPAWMPQLKILKQNDFYLALALSPIPFGLFTAYRFYKATFMDVVLKRGAALLAIFILSLIYARIVVLPLMGVMQQMPSESLQFIFFTAVWLVVYAIYPPLRDRIYRAVDRYIFKRRDYSHLLDSFQERLRTVTDEASLIETVSAAMKASFTADFIRVLPAPGDADDDLSKRLAKAFETAGGEVRARANISDALLKSELRRGKVELVMALRSGKELQAFILAGPRAYGQKYLSEELSVLRAVASQMGRTLENLRLHAARRTQEMAEAEMRKLTAQSELNALRAQIDPHFFFNSLNSVASLIHDDPAAAEELLNDIADLFRQSFRASQEMVSFKQELEFIETYLKIEKTRLGDKLMFRCAIPAEVLALRVPALTIQPLIENAVKHGIIPADRPGRLTLSASAHNERLNICVADTGVGIPATELPRVLSLGVGLANVNGRLTRLFGLSAALQIDSQAGQGTTISFEIPAVVEPAWVEVGQPSV